MTPPGAPGGSPTKAQRRVLEALARGARLVYIEDLGFRLVDRRSRRVSLKTERALRRNRWYHDWAGDISPAGRAALGVRKMLRRPQGGMD